VNRLLAMAAAPFMAVLGIGVVFGLLTGKGTYIASTCFWSIVILSIPLILDRHERVTLPWPVVLCAGIALILHAIGLIMEMYGMFWWDKLTHLVSGIVVASLVSLVLLVILHYSKTIRIPSKWFPFLLIISVLAFEGVWEILEFTVDHTMGTGMQYGFGDTVNDITTNLISGILAGFGASYFIGKSSVDKIVEGMKVEKTVRFLQKHVDR
jgi:hypothetical protein